MEIIISVAGEIIWVYIKKGCNLINKLVGIKIVIVGIFAAITTRLGNLAIPLYLLLALGIMDYITALRAAKFRGQKLDSDKGIRGIEKKVFMIVLIVLGGLIDVFIAFLTESVGFKIPISTPIAIGICLWLVINEIISVLENIKDILGDRVPSWLSKLLENVKSKIGQTVPKGEENANDNQG